jgi:hypothetical protein
MKSGVLRSRNTLNNYCCSRSPPVQRDVGTTRITNVVGTAVRNLANVQVPCERDSLGNRCRDYQPRESLVAVERETSEK